MRGSKEFLALDSQKKKYLVESLRLRNPACTAEDLMMNNHAILSKYKEVPAGSVKLGSTTTTYLNGKEITDQIFTSGSFDRQRMLNAVTGFSSLHFKTSNLYGAIRLVPAFHLQKRNKGN